MVLRIDDNVRTAFLFFLVGTGSLLLVRLLGHAMDLYAVAQMPDGLEVLAIFRNGYLTPTGILFTDVTSTLGERVALAFVCASATALMAALVGALVSKDRIRGARLFGRWTLLLLFAFLSLSALCWPPHALSMDPQGDPGTTISRPVIIGDLCWPWAALHLEGSSALKVLPSQDPEEALLVDDATGLIYRARTHGENTIPVERLTKILDHLSDHPRP